MSKNLPGLQYDRATDAWSIDKRIKGHGRIRQRLTAKTPEEAEKQFFQTIAQIQGEVHRREEGIMTFQEATDRYLDETQKRSIDRDRDSLRFVAPYIGELPPHLRAMSIFAANTGLREQGVCWLRWDWEVAVPELGTSIFITPWRKGTYADGVWPGEKNKEDQLVVLNSTAKAIIEIQRQNRQNDCPYVFPYRGKRVTRLHNSAWKKAWRAAGLPVCDEYTRGPHNLKHTFGHRLRVAGVSLETRKKLLHHTNGDITTHYSPASVVELLEAVEKIVNLKPVSILRRVI